MSDLLDGYQHHIRRLTAEVKMHLTDASQPRGIRCNNPLARGPATPDAAQVTCRQCQRTGEPK